MKNKKITLGIVDDHQIVIDGLKALLHGHEQFEVSIECTQPEEMISLIKKTPIDILLTDVMMPGLNGAELSKLVHNRFPEIKILALSMSGQGDLVNQMIDDANISGYVLKNIGKKDLILALEKISEGGIYFSEEVLQDMTRASEMKKENEEAHLTAREIEIIRLIEKELSNRKIAEKLFLSERTIETHRKNIFRKTNTASVIGLVKYAYEHKLI
jgi:Response regulator containing a CheY-like receiver domain and an HTH DNA-binding domain